MGMRLALLLALALVGCPSFQANQFKAHDGSDGWRIACPRGEEECTEAANERCPGGWTEQESPSSPGVVGVKRVRITIVCKGKAATPEGNARPRCGRGEDYREHHCTGTTWWVEETLSCEPC